MSAGLPSDEVAEDYKNSLEDLVINSRYEISNLTVIAKENTEHAMAISRVLENHIRSTPPDRKLPAMYVLDSIVKNIGTPYTLFLGRNLYNTFMNAYTLVNNQIRRKLDEMLKTWKEPVPGSLDTKPVFPPDVTRPIDNALIKARTAAVQQQQQQSFRSQQETMGSVRPLQNQNISWRNTPTPPQANGQYRPPSQNFTPQNYPQQVYPPQNVPNGHFQTHSPYPQIPPRQPSQLAPTPYQPPYQPPPPQMPQYSQLSNPQQDLMSLHREVEELIRRARDEFASNIHDTSIQTRLKALLDLQDHMQRNHLPPQQLQMIRDQVNALSRSNPNPPNAMPTPYPSSSMPSIPAALPPTIDHQLPSVAPDIQSLLSSSNLADIIAKAQRATPTPPLQHATLASAQQTTQHPPQPLPNITPAGGSDLIASLRAAGMISSGAPTPINGATLANVAPVIGSQAGQSSLMDDVELTSASLKVPRPALVSLLYESLPNQCSTCGKRFVATDEGRAKKARHLDWHFRTNQRMADAAKRGQSRSLYVGELEWIKSRDDPEDNNSDQAALASSSTGLGLTNMKHDKDPKSKYIPVPADQNLANLPCPICQEKFETVWSDEAQDFVWMDAVKIGGRIYHATCHSDVRRDGGGTPLGAGRVATPDSVLGKRKAEV